MAMTAEHGAVSSPEAEHPLATALRTLTTFQGLARRDGAYRWLLHHPAQAATALESAERIAMLHASGERTATDLLGRAAAVLLRLHPLGDVRAFLHGTVHPVPGRLLELSTQTRGLVLGGEGEAPLVISVELERTGDAFQARPGRWALEWVQTACQAGAITLGFKAIRQREVPDDRDVLSALAAMGGEEWAITPSVVLECVRREVAIPRNVPDDFGTQWRAAYRKEVLEDEDPWDFTHGAVEAVLEPLMGFLEEMHQWRQGVFPVQARHFRRDALVSLHLLPSTLQKACEGDPGLQQWWDSARLPAGGVQNGGRPVYTRHVSSELRERVLAVLDEIREKTGTGVLIHGGALAALDTLQAQQVGDVDVVYIDPPYNTGNRSYRYNDAYPVDIWSDWMRRSLEKARALCSSRASIWASIDDHAVHHLRGVMDAVFGVANHLGTVAWRKKVVRGRGARHLIPQVEYIHVHAVDAQETPVFEEPLTPEMLAEYRLEDGQGPYKRIPLAKTGTAQSPRPNLVYDIEAPDGTAIPCPTHQWRWSRETYARRQDEIEHVLGADGRWRVFTKQRPTVDGHARGRTPSSLQTRHTTSHGTRELKDVLGDLAVGFPKPTGLLRDIVTWTGSNNRVPPRWMLDFFGGSGTTVDSVLQIRASDPGMDVRVLCVEAGPWFEEALVRRVARRGCSRTWKSGEAVGGEGVLLAFDVWTLPDVEECFELLSLEC